MSKLLIPTHLPNGAELSMKVKVYRKGKYNNLCLYHPSGRYSEPAKYVVCVDLIANGNIVATGISRCSPKDQLNKKIGFAIAAGRAVKELRNTYHNTQGYVVHGN